MGAPAIFDFPAWIARYPEFAEDVDAPLAQAFFAEASIYHRNDGGGPVQDPISQLALLNMMTSHIAQLYQVENGAAVNELVGRITNASQGSVTVAADADLGNGISQWLAQTKYG